ncbi:ATP-binding cassette domain-containing protein [Gallaecimonas mangrovi]|uniref:ATP-binding cassette domain-containing protein n=1 Tax=Gallaecimonas mangrovi TaxID=2291597 RepID=UPI000E20779C|nr:ATP-binding cassette domain-containing protein [Gallaecimonas mangrovi]
MSAICFERLQKAFGSTQALKSISANIKPGMLTGLAGPDGAGKTTLIRLMAGLLHPDAGTLEVAGLIPDKSPALTGKVGYMPQRFGLYEDLSVIENLNLYADLKSLPLARRQSAIDELLTFTKLATFTGRLAGKLSGGMKQKLGLACALMGKPDVLLLDEPGVGVDPVSRQDLWRMVNALTDQGMAVLWATAYLDEAARCEEVLLLNSGEIAYQGPPQHLTDRLKGRCFRLLNPAINKRQLLAKALDLPAVRDGVIEGDALRLVLSAGQNASALTELGGEVSAVAPRFEDAFIDLLGGGPGGHSALADTMEPIARQDTAVVKCHHLSRRFGDFVATNNANFTVQQGQIFGLLGPNGAGKSTTFKMLCGLLKPSTGEAEVMGMSLASAPSKAKAKLGYMAQKFSLYGLLSVAQNLRFSAGVYGLKGKQKRQRITSMVASFGLAPFLNDAPDMLSLGFKQRLALACALMHRPPILFLDEPTSGVDPLTRREFWNHINGLVRKGVTVLVTTHFMDEAEYCDTVALMYKGNIIALDSPDNLKAKAASDSMEAAFIKLINAAEQP